MRFTFSDSLLHSTPVFGPDGEPWYHLTTGTHGGVSKIFRIRNLSPASSSNSTSEETLVESGITQLAMLSWGTNLPSKISIDISESYFDVKDIKRGFEFSDFEGRRFKWSLGPLGRSAPVLTLDDGSKTVIARFRRPKNRKSRKSESYLEVDDAYVDTLDSIIVTLVYVEIRRKFLPVDSSSITHAAQDLFHDHDRTKERVVFVRLSLGDLFLKSLENWGNVLVFL